MLRDVEGRRGASGGVEGRRGASRGVEGQGGEGIGLGMCGNGRGRTGRDVERR